MELLAALMLAAPPPMDAPPPPRGEPVPVEASDGAEAALRFERMFRGKRNPDYKGCCHKDHGHGQGAGKEPPVPAYLDAKPIPLEGLKNVTPMSPKLWKPADLLKDFEAGRGDGQEAVLVMVKTEFCHANEYRLCAVATAALEKVSTPEIRKFKVYGAWIRGKPRAGGWGGGREERDFDEEVALAYRFEQGPGAKLVVLYPGVDRPFEASAADLGLTVAELEKNKGETPRLERFLKEALESGRAFKRAK